MKPFIRPAIPLLAMLSIAFCSCDRKEKQMGKGFQMPEGDLNKGKAAFVDLKCTNCHDVAGAGLPAVADTSAVHFPLGGEVRKVKTYGELVTSIIQPQHIVSPSYIATLEKETGAGAPSPMPEFNETMTVRQLIDIVTFLHAHYSKIAPEYNPYPYYGPYGPYHSAESP